MTLARAVSASTSNDRDVTLVKPTEAQLRYAQFHHKRRAQAVKHRIDKLHNTPLEVELTIGKLDQDHYSPNKQKNNNTVDDGGYSSVNTEDTIDIELKAIRLRRPTISAGRRAFLKDSKRQYRRRRRLIEQHGYRGYFLDDDDDDDEYDHKGEETEGHFSTDADDDTDHDPYHDTTYNNDADTDADADKQSTISIEHSDHGIELNIDYNNYNNTNTTDPQPPTNEQLQKVFATKPRHQRRRRRKRGAKANSTTGSGDESYKRFQAACHAMMRNIQTSQPATPSITTPSKKWRRSDAHVAAAANLDYSRYKTSGFVKGRTTSSDRNAALLLSYKYYQQNQTSDYAMDKGASWLTHVPAKQSKRSKSNYYFSNMNELPHWLAVDHEPKVEVDDTHSDVSSALAMKQPGPQKFHRLMAYVQHKLIEKQQQQQQQQQILDGDQTRKTTGPGQSRTRELAEIIESPAASAATPNRIQQMADSIEGKSGTPTMKLRTNTPFSGVTTNGSASNRKRKGKSKYVPRMRLREFEGKGDGPSSLPRTKLSERFSKATDDAMAPIDPNDEGAANEVKNESSASAAATPPRMKLRESIGGQPPEAHDTLAGPSRTKEMALAFEGDTDTGQPYSNSKIQQIRKSLEPDTTPRMKLKGDFDRIDEKKAPDEATNSSRNVSRSTVDRLSQQFQSPTESSELEDFNKPSLEVMSEFSKHIDPRIFEQFEDDTAGDYSTTRRDSGGASKKRESAGSNVTEFFARIRGEQQQRQQQQQQHQRQPNRSAAHPPQSVSHPTSPAGSAFSDLSKESNTIGGLWNRGRHSISTLTSNLNTIAETQTQKGKGLLATTGLLKKFRGVPEVMEQNSLPRHDQQATLSDHAAPPEQAPPKLATMPLVDDEDALEALRGYRKNRASMSPEALEKASSEASSFHALPDQIRKVVQNSGGGTTAKAERPDYTSPNRSVATQSTITPSELSAEQYKRAHGRFLESSPILGGEFEHGDIIDTDDTQSDASDVRQSLDPNGMASLFMSPDILQKRLKQAVNSVEKQKWEQILFLINANPWLAEMKELTTNQYLLHKIAFFGTGATPAPISLSEQLVDKFPSAVHKFDEDGNVPLHLASAAGNVDMILMLGEKFSSGASIRNEDGMLPLHFAIASFAGSPDNYRSNDEPLEAIKAVMKLFPQAVAIADNDGNLPIHVASECLDGGVGVDVIYLLVDEAERQLEDPYGARFRNKVKIEELLDDEKSQGTMSTANKDADDYSVTDNDDLRCTMVLNDFNETPLLVAIRANKGWEMIEALVSGPGGRKTALEQDSDKNNALHLLVGEFQNATAAMSILKIVPETALHRNSEGILPIEMACMVMMPEEVILAIALVDLPIDINDREGLKINKDRGESWFFLVCDCDDHMVHVVEEILSLCSFQQLQELCFMKVQGSEQQTLIDKATPKCREAMNRSLRFLGRFEFLGDGPLFSDMQTGFKAFDALDFGGNEEGKPVLLECYQNEFDFEHRVYTMFDVDLDNNFVEEVNVYVEHLEEENASGSADEAHQHQRCVAIEKPRVKLNEVVSGMLDKGIYDHDHPDIEKRLKYSAKICSVLKLIAKAIKHLHDAGVVHGNVCTEVCAKFEDSSWKLSERLGVQAIGKPFDPARFLHSFPPESLAPLSAENDPEERDGSEIFDSDRPMVSFATDIIADVSIDVWAFGKICYECLVGKPLITFDSNSSESPSDDVFALLQTAEWNVSNMESVFAELLEAGIDESGADMITACLFPYPADRPANMDEILDNPFWGEIRKHRSPTKRRNRKSGESVSTSVSLLTDVDRYEV